MEPIHLAEVEFDTGAEPIRKNGSYPIRHADALAPVRVGERCDARMTLVEIERLRTCGQPPVLHNASAVRKHRNPRTCRAGRNRRATRNREPKTMPTSNNETTATTQRYGPPGRDPAERPRGSKPWLLTEAIPSAWVPLDANADPSGLEDDTDWPIEMAERAEARYAAEGYGFSGTAYAPSGGWEPTDADGNPRPPEEPFDGTYEGVFGKLQTVIWTSAGVLEDDLAAGKRPYPADGAEYLLDATEEHAVWLPACWWRLIEHGAWKASDFDDDEDEEQWGAACAREVFAKLHDDGWTPVRRLGRGYVERNEQFHGYKGELTLYLMRRGLQPKPIAPIERDC